MTVTFFSGADTFNSGGGGGGSTGLLFNSGGGRGGSTGVITIYDPAVAYAVGDWVVSSNAIWLARVAGTGLSPTLLNNNWRQIANVDSAQYNVFAGTNITTPTYNFPISQTAAKFDTSANSIVVSMPTISALSSIDTSNCIQWFRLFKISQANQLTVNLGAGNTFSDGSTSVVITAQGLFSFYCIFNSTVWYKG
jgi:hypothetical protein